MSDNDKRPEWRKGLDTVKIFYADAKINAFKLDFSLRATNGKNILATNSKQTWIELQGVFKRMTKNHSETWSSFKRHLNNRVYVYRTIKRRIAMFSLASLYLFYCTRYYKFNLLYRTVGVFLLSAFWIPDLKSHKKRLMIEMESNISSFFKG